MGDDGVGTAVATPVVRLTIIRDPLSAVPVPVRNVTLHRRPSVSGVNMAAVPGACNRSAVVWQSSLRVAERDVSSPGPATYHPSSPCRMASNARSVVLGSSRSWAPLTPSSKGEAWAHEVARSTVGPACHSPTPPSARDGGPSAIMTARNWAPLTPSRKGDVWAHGSARPPPAVGPGSYETGDPGQLRASPASPEMAMPHNWGGRPAAVYGRGCDGFRGIAAASSGSNSRNQEPAQPEPTVVSLRIGATGALGSGNTREGAAKQLPPASSPAAEAHAAEAHAAEAHAAEAHAAGQQESAHTISFTPAPRVPTTATDPILMPAPTAGASAQPSPISPEAVAAIAIIAMENRIAPSASLARASTAAAAAPTANSADNPPPATPPSMPPLPTSPGAPLTPCDAPVAAPCGAAMPSKETALVARRAPVGSGSDVNSYSDSDSDDESTPDLGDMLQQLANEQHLLPRVRKASMHAAASVLAGGSTADVAFFAAAACSMVMADPGSGSSASVRGGDEAVPTFACESEAPPGEAGEREAEEKGEAGKQEGKQEGAQKGREEGGDAERSGRVPPAPTLQLSGRVLRKHGCDDLVEQDAARSGDFALSAARNAGMNTPDSVASAGAAAAAFVQQHGGSALDSAVAAVAAAERGGGQHADAVLTAASAAAAMVLTRPNDFMVSEDAETAAVGGAWDAQSAVQATPAVAVTSAAAEAAKEESVSVTTPDLAPLTAAAKTVAAAAAAASSESVPSPRLAKCMDAGRTAAAVVLSASRATAEEAQIAAGAVAALAMKSNSVLDRLDSAVAAAAAAAAAAAGAGSHLTLAIAQAALAHSTLGAMVSAAQDAVRHYEAEEERWRHNRASAAEERSSSAANKADLLAALLADAVAGGSDFRSRDHPSLPLAQNDLVSTMLKLCAAVITVDARLRVST